jgi:hypothetical protein
MDDKQKQAPSSADEESNSRPVELVHAFFGVRLNETVTANVTVPVRRFGTRNNGTLYVHAVLYYPVPKSAAGALYEARNSGWRPNAPPVAHVSSAFTKTLPRSDANYAMLLSRDAKPTPVSKDTRAGEGGIAVEVSSVSADASSNTCVAATEPESERHANDEETDACAASEETRMSDKSSWKDDKNEDSAAEDSALSDVSGDRTEKKRLLVTHLRPRLTLFVVSKPPVFDRRKGMPSDLPLRIVRAPESLAKKGHKIAYAPLVMPDDVTTAAARVRRAERGRYARRPDDRAEDPADARGFVPADAPDAELA